MFVIDPLCALQLALFLEAPERGPQGRAGRGWPRETGAEKRPLQRGKGPGRSGSMLQWTLAAPEDLWTPAPTLPDGLVALEGRQGPPTPHLFSFPLLSPVPQG